MGLSMIGSYTGRIAPPGNPNITSTPSISRAFIKACPPLSCMAGAPVVDCARTKTKTTPQWEVGTAHAGRGDRRALREDYETWEKGGLAAHRGRVFHADRDRRKTAVNKADTERRRRPHESGHNYPRAGGGA